MKFLNTEIFCYYCTVITDGKSSYTIKNFLKKYTGLSTLYDLSTPILPSLLNIQFIFACCLNVVQACGYRCHAQKQQVEHSGTSKLKEVAMSWLTTIDGEVNEGGERCGLPTEHGGVFIGCWGKWTAKLGDFINHLNNPLKKANPLHRI